MINPPVAKELLNNLLKLILMNLREGVPPHKVVRGRRERRIPPRKNNQLT